jgi:hypothetical protein
MKRSTHADRKASHQHDESDHPNGSLRGLLDHLATLTRNQVRFWAATPRCPYWPEATGGRRHAFDLIGAPIPLS